jgi:hypothetical protein
MMPPGAGRTPQVEHLRRQLAEQQRAAADAAAAAQRELTVAAAAVRTGLSPPPYRYSLGYVAERGGVER